MHRYYRTANLANTNTLIKCYFLNKFTMLGNTDSQEAVCFFYTLGNIFPNFKNTKKIVLVAATANACDILDVFMLIMH